jgi:CheY-like chemotaxis protein
VHVVSSLPTVLLVDRSLDTLEMYAIGLTLAGYRTLTSTDADGGLHELQHANPRAIVTELDLDGPRTGWDLLRAVQQDPATRPVPVILLTGHWEPALADAARHAGFAAALLKPCAPEELKQVIDLLSQTPQ